MPPTLCILLDPSTLRGRYDTAGARAGYVYLHSTIDGYPRFAYTERLLDDTATAAVGFGAGHRVWFAGPGITRISPVVPTTGPVTGRKPSPAQPVTPPGSNGPGSPKRNGKIEGYSWILADELLLRSSVLFREAECPRAIEVWNIYNNYHRLHTTNWNRPPTHGPDPGCRQRHTYLVVNS